MTLYAYRIHRCFLNGWIDAGEMLEDVAEIDEGDEYLNSWREEMANRLEMAAKLFETMGWDTNSNAAAWFAPIPVAFGSPYAASDYMIAVESETETYIVSPYELPWLAAEALDIRRSELMDEPPTDTIQ